jgi:hypothetical protein
MVRPGPNLLARLVRESSGSCNGDATWWICVGKRSVTARNVGADGRVSLALEAGPAPVVAEGTVKVYAGNYPDGIVAAFSAKYGGWGITRPFEVGGRSPCSRCR